MWRFPNDGLCKATKQLCKFSSMGTDKKTVSIETATVDYSVKTFQVVMDSSSISVIDIVENCVVFN